MNTVSKILNPGLASAVTAAGHFDELVIADCGLPIPPGVNVIDLSVRAGLPSFRDVLSLIMSELAVEQVVIANELEEKNPEVFKLVQAATRAGTGGKGALPCHKVSHDEFKVRCQNAKWIVRTGENTPYANIILVAGVSF